MNPFLRYILPAGYLFLVSFSVFFCENGTNPNEQQNDTLVQDDTLKDDTLSQKDTVASNNCLRIISPNGGESFCVGSTIVIEYDILPGRYEEVAELGGIMDLFIDGRKTFLTNIHGDEQIDLAGDYTQPHTVEWTIPDTIYKKDDEGKFVYDSIGNPVRMPFPEGSTYSVRFRVYDRGAVSDDVYDISDEFFSIKACDK